MMTAIRLRSALMRVMLLAGMIPLFWVSDANAFGRRNRCTIMSAGSQIQTSLLRTVKHCLNKNHRISFYNFYWMDENYKNLIFYAIPEYARELVVILNGIDEDELNEWIIPGSKLYNEHKPALERNKLKLAEIFSKIDFAKLPEHCMNLTSTTGCYAEARRQLKLPSINEIKRRIRALDL